MYCMYIIENAPSGMLIRATRVPLDRIADLISANQILLVAACTDSCADYSLVDRPQTINHPSIHPPIHHASYYRY